MGDSDRKYLLTPLSCRNGPKEERYNASHIKTRAFGSLKRCLACLGSRMRTNFRTTQAINVASAIRHNTAMTSRLDMRDEAIEAHNVQNVKVNVDNFLPERYGGSESMQGCLK